LRKFLLRFVHILKERTTMRKSILVAVTLLCSGLWAVAQTSTSPSTSGSTGSDQSSASSQMGSTSGSGSSQSFTGCLSGSAGSYTLRDKATGTTYNLSGDDSQLAKHVGEEVRVSGTQSGNSAASASSPSSSATSSTGSTSGASGGNSLTVTSVSKVSSSCSNQ
jgi:hypothetical protein